MKTVLSVLFFLFATLSLSYAEVPQPDANGNIIINGDFTLAPGEVLNAPGNIIINGNINSGMPIPMDQSTGPGPVIFMERQPVFDIPAENFLPMASIPQEGIISPNPIGTIPSQIIINSTEPIVIGPDQELRAESIIINAGLDPSAINTALVSANINSSIQPLVAQQIDMSSLINIPQIPAASQIVVTDGGASLQ